MKLDKKIHNGNVMDFLKEMFMEYDALCGKCYIDLDLLLFYVIADHLAHSKQKDYMEGLLELTGIAKLDWTIEALKNIPSDVSFRVLFVIYSLDIYFSWQVRHCEIHQQVIRLQVAEGEVELDDVNEFNHARVEDVLRSNYCEMIQKCQNNWIQVSEELKNDIIEFIYPSFNN